MRHYTTSTGGVMSVQSTVLGRTWELPWAPTISSPERGAAAGEPKSPRPASGDRRAAAEGRDGTSDLVEDILQRCR